MSYVIWPIIWYSIFLIFITCVEVWPKVDVPPNKPPADEVVAPNPVVPPNKDGWEVVVVPKPKPCDNRKKWVIC